MVATGFVSAGSLRVLVRRASPGPRACGAALVIQRIARETWRSDTGIGRGQARTNVFSYLLRGRLRLEHAGQQQLAGPGQLVAVPQGADYRLWVQPGADLEHVIWNATGGLPDAWWQGLGRGAPCVLPVHRRGEIERCLEDLLQHCCSAEAAAHELARPYLELILGLATLTRPRARSTSRATAQAERCHALIASRGLAFAGVAELAAELALHPDYLSRVYRARYGASPAEHLRRQRMERASQLLQDPDLDLAQVAAELGYADAFAFSKAFKGYAGLSPRHWRQQFGRG